MQDLRITIMQSDLYWQNAGANRGMFEENIWDIKDSTDLIILPEMFTTGFTMEAEKLAEPMNFTTFKWMKQMAAQAKAVITGSYIVKENGQYFNRLVWMQPNGNFSTYDKRHLFRMANEHHHFSAGSNLLITYLKGWRICPLICYDLRFPVWSRNIDPKTKTPRYDLALYVANWPQARISAWDTLLKARAIENLAYVAGVNRTAPDGNGVAYNGHTAVIDPKGKPLLTMQDEVRVDTIMLSGKDLMTFREKFPAHEDADGFEVKV